jgi:hypothetical protein
VNGSATCCSSLDEVRMGIDAVAEFVSPEVCFHSLFEPARLSYCVESIRAAFVRVLRVHMTR